MLYLANVARKIHITLTGAVCNILLHSPYVLLMSEFLFIQLNILNMFA